MVFLCVITLTLVDVEEPSAFMLIFVKSANLHHMVPEAVLAVCLKQIPVQVSNNSVKPKQSTKNN